MIVLNEDKTPLDPQRCPESGDLVKETINGATVIRRYYAADETAILTSKEKQWAISELRRTDEYMIISDYPHTYLLIPYRQALRDYQYDGNRPEAPTTPSGTPI